jgi:hypothetical protein
MMNNNRYIFLLLMLSHQLMSFSFVSKPGKGCTVIYMVDDSTGLPYDDASQCGKIRVTQGDANYLLKLPKGLINAAHFDKSGITSFARVSSYLLAIGRAFRHKQTLLDGIPVTEEVEDSFSSVEASSP